MRKISPPPGFDPRTVQPVASRYTDYATPPIRKGTVLIINCCVDSVCLFLCLVTSFLVCLFRLCVFLVCNYWNFTCNFMSCLMSLWIQKILGRECAELAKLCEGSEVPQRSRYAALNLTGRGTFTLPQFIMVQFWTHSRTIQTVVQTGPSAWHNHHQAPSTVSKTDCFSWRVLWPCCSAYATFSIFAGHNNHYNYCCLCIRIHGGAADEWRLLERGTKALGVPFPDNTNSGTNRAQCLTPASPGTQHSKQDWLL